MKLRPLAVALLAAVASLHAPGAGRAEEALETPGFIATGTVIGAGQGLNHGTLRIAGNFREGPEVLNLARPDAILVITSLLEEWDDPEVAGEGGELLVDLPLTLVNRLSNTDYAFFETPPGTKSALTGLPLFARVYVTTCVSWPCRRGRALGRWNYQIDLVNATVEAPAQCNSLRRTKMTTSFTIDDGVNPPLDVVTTEKTWKCRDSNRVLVTP